MKGVLKIFVLAWLVLTPLAPALAACMADGYTVVYINGIRTSRNDADVDKKRFSESYADLSNRRSVSFVLGYNPTALWGLGDLTKAILQSYEPQVFEDLDLQSIITQLHTDITTRRVLLVGHSQGTFYANAVRDFLISHGMSPQSVAVYNIATPASGVSGGGAHITSSNDRVINKVRDAQKAGGARTALPANATLELPESEKTDPSGGHYFRSDYLAYADTRIMESVDTALRSLSTDAKDDSTGYCFDLPAFSSLKAVANTTGATAIVLAKLSLTAGKDAAQATVSAAKASVSTLSSVARAIIRPVIIFASSRSAPAQAQSTPQGASAGTAVATLITPTPAPQPVPTTPAPAPAKAEVTPPAVTQPPVVPPSQPVTPEMPHTSQTPLPPIIPLSRLGLTVTPGFGASTPPPPETPAVAEALPLAPLSVTAPQDNESFATTSITASGTTTPSLIVSLAIGESLASTTANEDGDWAFAIDLQEGTSTLIFSVSNDDGVTTAVSRSVFVTLPLPEPAPLFVFSPDDSAAFATSSVTASGTTTPSLLVAAYAGDILLTSTTADPLGDWSLPLTLSEGTTTLSFAVSNDAGTTTISRSVFVDTVPPEAPVLAVEPCWDGEPSFCVALSSTLNFSWSDIIDAVSYALTVDGVSGSLMTATSSSYTFPVERQGETSIFSVTAFDAFGNAATSSEVSVQAPPPPPPPAAA